MTQTPLALRMRPDLEVFPQPGGERPAWVVKDPIALRYQRLGEEEFAILQWLDGRTGLDEIRDKFAQRFPPQQLSRQQLHQFLGRLHRQGLLLAESPGQHETLLERGTVQRRWEWFQRLTNVLAIRFRGADPTGVLNWLHRRVRWMFSRFFLVLCLLLVLGAAALVVIRIDAVLARLPALSDFLRVQNVLWLAATLAVVKVLHELGHALVCKHFGGECHEIGMMLLVFTPCLYCDVSDSWTWPSRWRRMAVAAAGMGVELVLAAAATFLWWFSQPGWLNQMCLNVMVLCSISTLVFNGNPLLRYDGYYVLSDLLDAPNLGGQSRALVRQALASFFLGIPVEDALDLPERRRPVMAAYAVASTLYSWCVVGAILLFVYRFLEPKRLEILAAVVAVPAAVGLLSAPSMYLFRLLRDPVVRHRVRRGRLAWSTSLALAVFAALLAIPLPCRVTAPWIAQAEGTRRVYVPVPGRLVSAAEPGTSVRMGQTVAQLKNLELECELAQLSGQRKGAERRLSSLEARQAVSPEAAVQIPTTRESLADLERRWQERAQDIQRLTLSTPISGTVLPPPAVADQAVGETLPIWRGTPLDKRNVGSWLETGTLLCEIGNAAHVQAVLAIDQTQVEFVRQGQRVWLQPNQLPGRWLAATIFEIAKVDENAPDQPDREEPTDEARLSRTRQDAEAVRYQAIARLDDPSDRLLLRTGGAARVVVIPQPLWARVFRYLARTFSLPL